jgi:hypothetical protein
MPRFTRLSCGLLTLFLTAIAARTVEAQGGKPEAPAAKPADRSRVLVELFTSEGCPHCPEADALLERLYSSQAIEGAEIVALEEHVDYWDRPAWVDHFSSPVYTARQKLYADAMDLESLYTPQMVVDGLVGVVGNNEGRARATITALVHAPKATAQFFFKTAGAPGGKAPPPAAITIQVDLPAGQEAAEVYLVVAEDKLFSRVEGGSNAGETWPHSSVARRIQLAGKIRAGETRFSGPFEFHPPERAWRWQNLRLVLFVQEEESRRVIAVTSARLADFLPEAPGEGQPAAGGVAPDASQGAPKAASDSSNPHGAELH